MIFFILLFIIIIEPTHSKATLENTVEIEPQPVVALDFNNLYQYLSVTSKTVFWTCDVPVTPICFSVLPNCLGIAP